MMVYRPHKRVVYQVIPPFHAQQKGGSLAIKAIPHAYCKSAYDPSRRMAVPADFLKQLAKDKTAYAFFKTLNKASLYAIAWRLQTPVKPETRERRMKTMLALLAQRINPHRMTTAK
jgi:uncharacterized protein YdeI (YjbR/CyaY-like superfamily)